MSDALTANAPAEAAAAGVRYYPIYLTVAGETCLVAGPADGAPVGEAIERAVRELLVCGARVVVAAPAVSPQVRAWIEAEEVEWRPRPATAADAEAAFVVLAATGDPALDAALVSAAEARGALGTRLEDERSGNCLLPPCFRQGDLTIAVSTSGRLPQLEDQLIERLRPEYGPEWATFLAWLGEKRAEVKARHPSIVCRTRLWDDVVSTNLLDLIRQDRLAEARDLYETTLRDWWPDDSVPIEPNCCRAAEVRG